MGSNLTRESTLAKDQEEVWKATPVAQRYTIAGVRHIERNGRLVRLQEQLLTEVVESDPEKMNV